MIECPEYCQNPKEKKGRGIVSILRRYREAKKALIERADSLKGKDEARREKLMRAAANMDGKRMTTEQIRRKALCAELDLYIDQERNTQ